MLEIRSLSKCYGNTVALQGLTLAIPTTGVFGIAGPNGAGKSTLVRILAGEEAEDSGAIELDGKAWSALERQSGVAVVHQEPQLFPNLTVLENLHFGLSSRGPRRPSITAREREVLEEMDLTAFAGRELGTCPLVVWQLTEIARALLRDSRVFLFDEPNSAIGEEESERLFAQLRRLTQNPSHIVAIVSHRLADLSEQCQAVAIVREGQCNEVLTGTAVTEHAIARALVVGHKSSAIAATRPPSAAVATDAEPIARLEAWSAANGSFAAVDLDLRAGEVVSIMGVEGSGGRELVRSLAGLEHGKGGYTLLGRSGRGTRSRDVAYMPAARRNSLFHNFSIGANVGARLGWPEIASRGGVVSFGRLENLAGDMISRFRVVATSPAQSIGALSGGNQQKVALAGTVVADPRLLAIEEPTRGVDIGTKADIHRMLRDYAASGNAVVIFCTEAGEAFDAADVVLVASGGRISKPIDVHEFSTLEDLASTIAMIGRDMRRSAEAEGARTEPTATAPA